MDSDLGDLRYLYSYGDYISEVELKTAEFLNGPSDEEIKQMRGDILQKGTQDLN